MKRIVLLIALLSALMLTAFESGKLIHKPEESVQSLYISDKIMISSKFAMPGLLIDTGKFYTHMPIFSHIIYHEQHIIGTGMSPMIYNIDKNDTIILFEDGETVYQMVTDNKENIWAVVIPSGLIINIKEGRIDTIAQYENRGINILERIGNRVYAAIENELYIINGVKMEKILTVNDKNISYLKQFGDALYIGTEGKGKVIEFKNGKQKTVYASKSGEVDFISVENNAVMALINTKISPNENELNYVSTLINIFESKSDTLFSTDDFIISAESYDGGILMVKAKTPEIMFFKNKSLFSCGLIKADYILSIKVLGKYAYITTGDPGRIFSIKGLYDNSEYISNVIDFGKKVFVNTVHVSAEGKGKLYFRQGDSYDADSSWTDFILLKPGMTVNSDEYRYMQYKYMYSSSEDKLKDVSIYYRTKNHAPGIDSIRVFDPRIIPDYVQTEGIFTYPVFNTSMYPEYDNNIMKTDAKVIFAIWYAGDMDNDLLEYDVFLKDRFGLYPVKKNIYENYVLIYAEGFDQGNYEIIVRAGDSLSNVKDPLYSEMSENIFIDNTAPQINDMKFEKNTLTLRAVDESSFLDEMYYAVNGGQLMSAMPDDGIFDSNAESFTVHIEKIKNEDLFVVVYIMDQYGNIARSKKLIR